jgi:hypothetical protein
MSSAEGFQLEEIIHKALSTIPFTHNKREQEIRTHFEDTSLNGVDHWVSKGDSHVLIQDKWKETTNQQEVAQFLTCAERIRSRLPPSANVYLLWVGKKEPTSNSQQILKEKGVYIINCSFDIDSLARNAVLVTCKCLGEEPTPALLAISTAIPLTPMAAGGGGAQKVEETKEEKEKKEKLEAIVKQIQQDWIQRMSNAVSSCCVGDMWPIFNSNFPTRVEDWNKFKKIDFNAFMKIMKKMCWPGKGKRVSSYSLFHYSKVRYISVHIQNLLNQYNTLREDMVSNKSAWAKTMPVLKCTPEPMSAGEFEAVAPLCQDYWKGMEHQFYQQYQSY